MKFIVVSDMDSLQHMVNLEAIKYIREPNEHEHEQCGAVIHFFNHPDALLWARDKYEDLRARISDLELPMPGAQ